MSPMISISTVFPLKEPLHFHAESAAKSVATRHRAAIDTCTKRHDFLMNIPPYSFAPAKILRGTPFLQRERKPIGSGSFEIAAGIKPGLPRSRGLYARAISNDRYRSIPLGILHRRVNTRPVLTLMEALATELERPRELKSKVIKYLNGNYAVDEDSVGVFLVHELPKLEDYEIDLIL